MITFDFIKAAPKTDLHLHLDGSVRLQTLVELAKENKVLLPSYTEDGLKQLVFKDTYRDLGEYLHGFQYTCAVMQTAEALERVGYELAVDNILEGVRYIEVRFAPQLHINASLSAIDVLQSVHRGLARAAAEENARLEVQNGEIPKFHFGIIVCALRMFNEKFSSYYKKLLQVCAHTKARAVFGIASMELAQLAVAIRDENEIPIVGFDLAGQEMGYPAEDHREAFGYAHRYFLKKTIHAGEAYGPESIFQAITECNADRIGHGMHLLNYAMIQDKSITDPRKYIEDLSQYIADRRITVEICLTSNMQTNQNLKDLAKHPLGMMIQRRLSTTICTDNRTVSNTTVSDEIWKAVQTFAITPRVLRNIIIYGFKRSFFPGSYLEKRAYVRGVIDYYDKMASAHLGPHAVGPEDDMPDSE
ncbi:MAG: adenosine deaminase family protein [Myxococcales bacterium]|nr:adenosine deaminase family protein [Myxococcales bacterium]